MHSLKYKKYLNTGGYYFLLKSSLTLNSTIFLTRSKGRGLLIGNLIAPFDVP